MKIGNLEVYGIIYKITNKLNGKSYIGQTIKERGFLDRYPNKGKDIERVYKYHKSKKDKGCGYNEHLLRSIEKYGFKSFEVCQVFDVAFSKEELNMKEMAYIRLYKCFENGYNQTLGGEGTNGMKSLSGKECPTSRKVCQISTDGKLIKIWDCISDVERDLKIDSSKISCVCRGKRKTTQGFVWVYYEDYDENKDYATKPRSKDRKKGLKPVIMVKENNRIITEFKSVNEASRKLNISTFEISSICSRRKTTKYNFDLFYKKDYEINI